ncbi:MAG TPA: hypothetical protein VHI10_08480, partial [Mycobacterium sp.]|nr:hypothetical protein [Mycobacterium sp.]
MEAAAEEAGALLPAELALAQPSGPRAEAPPPPPPPLPFMRPADPLAQELPIPEGTPAGQNP